MRNYLFCFFILLSSTTLLSQKVNLSFHLKNFPDSTIYLASYYGDQFRILDTLELNNYYCTFVKEESLPQGIYTLASSNKIKYSDFIIDQDQDFLMITDHKYLIDSLRFDGSEANNAFANYLKYSTHKNKQNKQLKKFISMSAGQEQLNYIKQQNQITKDIKEYRIRHSKYNPETLLSALFNMMREVDIPKNIRQLPKAKYNYYLKHYWDYLDLTDERLIRTPILSLKTNTFFDQVVVQQPDSLIQNIDLLLSKPMHAELYHYFLFKLALKYEHPKVMGLDKVFVHIADQYIKPDHETFSSAVKDALLERAEKIRPLLLGKFAPNLNLIDTLNQYQSFYDINSKYTILVFWDHDCQQCQRELRLLKGLHQNKLFEIEIYAIESTNQYDKWKDYIKSNDLKWMHVNGTQSTTEDFRDLYNIYTTPTIFILDQNKCILAKQIAAKNISAFLRNYEQHLTDD